MKKDETTISVHTAHLIIGFLHNRLSDPEKDELDNWICLSDTNLKIFEQLTQDVDENVFDADKLIIETESAIDLWIIAALIVRQQKGMNNEVEEKYLDDWINQDKWHKELFKKLQNSNYMQQMLVWNRLKREEIYM